MRWFAMALVLAGCRTVVLPIVKVEPPRPPLADAPETCVVHDYRTATDVPAGSTNLGWIVVPVSGTDDETFVKLREAICAKGGTALSQAHWNRPAGASVADPPIELEANAWVEP